MKKTRPTDCDKNASAPKGDFQIYRDHLKHEESDSWDHDKEEVLCADCGMRMQWAAKRSRFICSYCWAKEQFGSDWRRI